MTPPPRPSYKRRHFWIDPPLQLQMLLFVTLVVAGSLILVWTSVINGLMEASAQSRQIFHSIDWVRASMRAPFLLSGSIALLAAALITLVWSHRYAGPLRVLSAGMLRLRHGNLSVAIRIRKTDTHQDLIREFGQMQEELHELLLQDRKRVEALLKRLDALTEGLPPNGELRDGLDGLAADLKAVGAKFRL